MKNPTKDQLADFARFYKKDGDPDFSPERNKKIVEDSIKEYEFKRAMIQKQFGEHLEERTDAVAYLLKAIDNGKDTNALKYFGKKELARLRGEQIMGEMRLRMAAAQRGINAKKKYKN